MCALLLHKINYKIVHLSKNENLAHLNSVILLCTPESVTVLVISVRYQLAVVHGVRIQVISKSGAHPKAVLMTAQCSLCFLLHGLCIQLSQTRLICSAYCEHKTFESKPHLMVWLRRTVEKLAAKDDQVRALEDERCEMEQKIEAQHQEFAQREELLKSDHEELQRVVSRCVTCFMVIANLEQLYLMQESVGG